MCIIPDGTRLKTNSGQAAIHLIGESSSILYQHPGIYIWFWQFPSSLKGVWASLHQKKIRTDNFCTEYVDKKKKLTIVKINEVYQ